MCRIWHRVGAQLRFHVATLASPVIFDRQMFGLGLNTFFASCCVCYHKTHHIVLRKLLHKIIKIWFLFSLSSEKGTRGNSEPLASLVGLKGDKPERPWWVLSWGREGDSRPPTQCHLPALGLVSVVCLQRPKHFPAVRVSNSCCVYFDTVTLSPGSGIDMLSFPCGITGPDSLLLGTTITSS